MNCGSCPFTDGLCYASMPPQVKCSITNEFHYYSNECDCIERMQSQKEELDFVKKKLSEPSPLMIINYDGPSACAVSFSNEVTGDETAAAFNNLLNSKNGADGATDNKISVKPVTSTIELDDLDRRLLEPICMYATRCLVCDIEVPVYCLRDGPKICKECKRAIKFIKENFIKELDKYEM